jgi:hypothetical protein
MTIDESNLTSRETQSPFLFGTKIQYAWDSTSLNAVKTCPRLYQYTIIDGWASKFESVHLRFGIEYHQALQEYDVSRANGVLHEDSIHDVVRALLERTADWSPDPTTKAGKYKNRQTLIGLVIDYLDHFSDDPAETYIKADGTPAVELSFRFELDWGPKGQGPQKLEDYPVDNEGYIKTDKLPTYQPYLLCGHLDRVVNFNDSLMVMDRKTTTTTLSQYYFAQYEPNNQMSLYTFAGQIIMDAPIKGTIIDAAQVMLDKPNRFVRGFTFRTPSQIEEWLTDLKLTLARAEEYATNDYWPMNDTACDKFGGCRFREICSKDPAVRNNFLKADFIQQEPDMRWNPLKSR